MGAVAAAPTPGTDATPAVVGPIRITIPAEFQPFQTQRHGNGLTSAWTHSVRGGKSKALLQITVTNLSSAGEPSRVTSPAARAPAEPSSAESAGKDPSTGAPAAPKVVERHLQQTLDELRQRRSSFTATAGEPLQLAGLPALRATWTGAVADWTTVGVVYSVLVPPRRLVVLQVQDLGHEPSEAMLQAMHAIETLSLP